MADAKTTALASLTDPVVSDLLVAVDDPAGSPVTKKLAISALLALAMTNVVVQVKTAGSGTYTPTSGMKKVLVICVGGGGGSPAETVADAAVSGGGGGGAAIKLFDAATIGASQAYTVAATSTGAGNTSGLGTANALLQATGGAVGVSTGLTTTVGVGARGGQGGIGTLGDLNIRGGSGGRGTVYSTANAEGGNGGNSILGGGGRGGSATGVEAGEAGGDYGGGAGGGQTSNGNDISAVAGAQGVIYFIEFLNV